MFCLYFRQAGAISSAVLSLPQVDVDVSLAAVFPQDGVSSSLPLFAPWGNVMDSSLLP